MKRSVENQIEIINQFIKFSCNYHPEPKCIYSLSDKNEVVLIMTSNGKFPVEQGMKNVEPAELSN